MTTATAPTIGRRAAVDLAAVREQWGDLLAAIGRRPAAEWPPRECAGFLDQLAADDRAEDDATPVEAVVGRLPLTIREHPAPLNLDALDAALAVERDLFDLADAVAEQVQRPIGRRVEQSIGSQYTPPTRVRLVEDRADRDDPGRWHPVSNRDIGPANATSAGSRGYGLHWAAVWLEGRALDEPYSDLFRPVPHSLLDHMASTAAHARRAVERALQRDGRTTTLPKPCPWCGGELTGCTRAGGEPYVTCARGEACGAPVSLDRGRRIWRGTELVGLWTAMPVPGRSEEERVRDDGGCTSDPRG
ncbi:hypothetical protein AB0I27_06815 [Streptomyces sp. NPDC050597]|uniref:hypothetical protein n=1 Tax=Streptomyces sp. NPDC050597 TaxID=3157212 RepID=UPI00341F9F43